MAFETAEEIGIGTDQQRALSAGKSSVISAKKYLRLAPAVICHHRLYWAPNPHSAADASRALQSSHRHRFSSSRSVQLTILGSRAARQFSRCRLPPPAQSNTDSWRSVDDIDHNPQIVTLLLQLERAPRPAGKRSSGRSHAGETRGPNQRRIVSRSSVTSRR
jgi:hypothetical protein